MNPAKVNRNHLQSLLDLPNVGRSIAADLNSIGITEPEMLAGRDPLELYRQLCVQAGSRQDPCLLDVLISVTRFMDGEEARPWWEYTPYRKASYPGI
jgi:hypothetical protein